MSFQQVVFSFRGKEMCLRLISDEKRFPLICSSEIKKSKQIGKQLRGGKTAPNNPADSL